MKHPIISKAVVKEAGLPAVITFSSAAEQTCDGHSWTEASKILSDNGAEALGRTVPASEYSPDIDLHPIFGDEASQKKTFRECLYGLKLDD